MISLVSPEVDAYAERYSQEPLPLLEELRVETFAHVSSPQMQVGRIEGQFLKMLVQSLNAKRVVELGMFTGYSALCMAAGLPDDGELVTCDVNPVVEEVARRYFARSPHGKKIHIRMGPALKTLATLRAPLDLAFIDADKENYPAYYEALVPLMRSGGLIVADNVLWSGQVTDPKNTDADTAALRAYAEKAKADARVEHVLLTVRDGMLIARKK